MGNTPSVQVRRRRTHKLSKPRTGSHAPAGLLSPNGFSSSAPRRFSLSYLNSRPLPPSPAPSPTTPTSTANLDGAGYPDRAAAEDREAAMALTLSQTEASSWHLLRSLPSQISSAHHRRRRSSVGPAPPTTETPTRARSMTYDFTIGPHFEQQLEADEWPASCMRASWNYNMSSYEAKRLLNVAEDTPFEHAASMSETRISSLSEATWQSSNPADPIFPSGPISRANSDLSMYTPVRRRSVILTPGVATRTWDNAPLPPLPPANPAPMFYYDGPPTPGHSRQQSRDSTHRGDTVFTSPEEMDQNPPRVATPCEDEYQSIGAFKLGSLRITNGAASPASPETDRHRDAGRGNDGDNSSSAREGDDYFSHLPAKREQAAEPPSQAPAIPESGPPLKPSSPGSSETSPQYLAEMTQSPVSLANSRSRSPELQITSKHTALEDRLFDDDGQPEYSASETLDVRMDPSARSHHPSPSIDGSEMRSRSGTRTDSGRVSIASPSPGDPLRKPLNKADSGYGSNASLRSFSGSKHPLPDKDLTQLLDRRLSQASPPSEASEAVAQLPPSELDTTAAAPAQPKRDAPPPPVPPKDVGSESSPKLGGAVPPRKASTASTKPKAASRLYTRLSAPTISRRKSRHTPSPINSLRSVKSITSKSLVLSPRTPGSVKSDTSASALSIGGGSHKLNRLQRLLSGTRRGSNGPPTVHPTHAIDESTIPSIPPDVRSSLREHDGHLPVRPKRRSLNPQPSHDTLMTEFSVCSLEQSLDAISAIPSPPLSGEPLDEEADSKGTETETGPKDFLSHLAQAGGKMVSRKQIPTRRSSIRSQESQADLQPVFPPTNLAGYGGIMGAGDGIVRTHGNDESVSGLAGPEESPAYHQPRARRTRSLTSFIERNLDLRKIPHRAQSSVSLSGPPPLNPLPSPLLERTPSPARVGGMPTPNVLRRPASLKFSQSLRTQFQDVSLGDKSVSRRTSLASLRDRLTSNPLGLGRDDALGGYPPFRSGDLSGGGVPDSPPLAPHRALRRSISNLRPRHAHSASQPIIPNWEVQTDHDISAQETAAWLEHERSASLRRTESPSNTNVYYAYQGHPSLPPLRHRSSYDVSSHGRGYPPSMSNGYTALPGGPCEPRSTPQPGPAPPQWGQYRGLPYVPRGHYRNRSLGNGYGHPAAPPYRVLHSYNSPAYRNVPIWG